MSMKSVVGRVARRAARTAGAATIFGSARSLRVLGFEALGARQDFVLSNVPGKEIYVVSARDEIIGRELFQSGEFDFAKFELACTLLGQKRTGWRPRILLDVGGNIGTISIPAVARGFVERAIAIEPDPQNCRLLRANIELNGLAERIAVHQAAAGAEPNQMLQLGLSDYNMGDHRISAPRSGAEQAGGGRRFVTVSSTTLDSLCGDLPADGMLVWIDVQGYEAFVLEGSRSLLASRVPFVLEFSPGAMARNGSFPLMQASLQGYSAFIDLADPGRSRPISELKNLYDEIGIGGTFTDILLL